MNAKDAIEIQAEVVPYEPGIETPDKMKRACALVVRGDRHQLFAPPVQVEMRGRRPSGVMMHAENVPKEAQGKPLIEEPPDLGKVPKRTAQSVAAQMAGVPAQCRDLPDGRCEIVLVFPIQSLSFVAATWFRALGSVKHYIDNRGKKWGAE